MSRGSWGNWPRLENMGRGGGACVFYVFHVCIYVFGRAICSLTTYDMGVYRSGRGCKESS